MLVSNHISAGDTFLLPAMIKRRLTFPAKAELFEGRGLSGRFVGWFMRAIGQLPMDRSGGRASATSMDGVLAVLEQRRSARHLPRRHPIARTAGSTRARPASPGWCCRQGFR